jgi:hypothetical protein
MILRQQLFNVLVAILLALALPLSLHAEKAKDAYGPHSLSVGGRYNMEQSAFCDLPYGNGDISYLLAYQYTQGIAIWQFACDVGPDVSGKREEVSGSTTNMLGIDYVLTPQFNIIIRDSYFRGGGGIRTSYIKDAGGGGEWLDPYWQLQLGLAFPLSQRLSVDLSAYYVLQRWDKIVDFTFGDLEYGALLNFAF